MIVIACTDSYKVRNTKNVQKIEDRYDTQLVVLLCSLKINYFVPTTVYCINFDENKINKLRILFPFANFILVKEKMNFYNAYKPIACEKCLNLIQENDHILWLDTDMLVRKSLTDMVSSTNGIKVRLRLEYKDTRFKVNTGSFCIKKTQQTKKFIDEWKKLIDLSFKKDWLDEQNSFWQSSVNTNILLEDMGIMYNNYRSDPLSWSPDTAIWHNKSQHNNKLWINESNKYLQMNKLTIETLWN